MPFRSFGVLLLLSVVTCPYARADSFSPLSQGTRLSLQTDFWPTQDSKVATMAVTAQVAVRPWLMLDAEVPWAVGASSDLEPPTQTTAIFGNVTVGAHGVISGSDLVVHLGGTVTSPTRLSPYDSPATGGFAEAADFSRGFFDLHRFMPQAVSVRLPVGLEVRFLSFLYLRCDLNAVVLVPVGQGAQNAETAAVLEQSDELETRSVSGFGGGLRFQAAFAIAGSLDFGRNQLEQSAIEPFVGYEPPSRGVIARLGLLVALDEPAGFGLEKDKLTSVRLMLGYKF